MEPPTDEVEPLYGESSGYCLSDKHVQQMGYLLNNQKSLNLPVHSLGSVQKEEVKYRDRILFESFKNTSGEKYRSMHQAQDSLQSQAVQQPSSAFGSSYGSPYHSMDQGEKFEVGEERRKDTGRERGPTPSINIDVSQQQALESINNDAHWNSLQVNRNTQNHSFDQNMSVPSQSSSQGLINKIVLHKHSALLGTASQNDTVPLQSTAHEGRAPLYNMPARGGPLSLRNQRLNQSDVPNESATSENPSDIGISRAQETRTPAPNVHEQGSFSYDKRQNVSGTTKYDEQIMHLNHQGFPQYEKSQNPHQGPLPELSVSERLLDMRPPEQPSIESMQQWDNRGLQKNVHPVGFLGQNAPLPHGNQYDTSHTSSQHQADGGQGRKRKKVFILHYDDVPEFGGENPVLRLAVALRQLDVDVTLDLFERDVSSNNWSFWYEESIRSSDVVLCIITEKFYENLTTGNRVMGYSLYNLMNSSSVAVRAVFLNAPKNLDFAPPAIRGATSYRIDTNWLDLNNNEEFASLYAFLTGQNRIEKPPLGNMVKLAPKRSRFGQNQGGQRTAAPAGGFNRGQPFPGGYNMGQPPPGGYNIGQPPHGGYNMGQPPHGGFNRGPPPPMAANRGSYQPVGFNQGPPPQLQFQPSGHGAPPGPAASQPDVDQANLLYSLLAGDTTAISTVRTHNRMFQTLATKMAADWEPLGRALGLRDPEVYAIRRDHGHSVVEQAVQMFRTWLEKNGSRATFGALTMAVYDTGMQYWNLLEILNKHTL